MNRAKRGQSANSAAIVIILIAVMIILYILFLPPEDRAALLGEDSSGGGPGGVSARTTILSKTPGRIYPSGSNIVEHKLPSFLVFTASNANELKRADSVYTKNSVFSSKTGEVVFFYDERTMKDPKLSFNVLKQSGQLTIKLNGVEIYSAEVQPGSPPPINIPVERLTSKNTLTFEVSSPGAIFWRVNEYSLSSVVVSATVTDYSGAASEQHFAISDLEYQKMEKSLLEFLPDCPPREEGQLQIILNGRPLYTSYPDCGVKASIEVSQEFIRPGDNTLVALTSSGSFLMDNPKFTTFLKEEAQPVFYFTVPPTLMDAIFNGARGLLLTIRFADSTTIKRGVVEINGFKNYFDTQDFIYQTPIDPESILEGSNGAKIVPVSGALDVVELRVDVI